MSSPEICGGGVVLDRTIIYSNYAMRDERNISGPQSERSKEQFSPRETNLARPTWGNKPGRSGISVTAIAFLRAQPGIKVVDIGGVGRAGGAERVCGREEAWNDYRGTPNSAAKRSFVFQHRAREGVNIIISGSL